MKHTFALAALAAAMLALAACGGGGGGGASAARAPANPHAVVDWPVSQNARSLTAGAPLDMTSNRIKAAFNGILRAADTLHVGDVLTSAGRASLSCVGFVCSVAGGEPTRLGTEVVGEYRAVMSRRGVSLAQSRYRNTEEGAYDGQGYEGWMAHSAFGVEAAAYDDGAWWILPYSYGNASNTNPTVSGAWSGVMIGADMSPDTRADVVQGDATLDVEMGIATGVSHVDVAFTNIKNLDTGAALRDMGWTDLVIASDGGFRRGSGANSIKGGFYGPNHEEVGGVFEKDLIVGAFGAVRAP